eukprot:CAMPEP_0173382460 /NCGR_PEP_ID=MMETSP1356-20130122/4960_1 /TAXON_ID=77927 ORGANISM="Hemiselmis virescens, Strain PCC157" /NCGR_SAMPLE_ID=MMETSP1356 /ASSEMBLY_ACC=CAM_ASM_000847 /LENGTH=54 /DNA_ID=CAMNT_0014336803 /DNA_START=17 /DNA_END=177 /DNA_ORIENTATION=+
MEEKGTLRGHSKDNPECTCKFHDWGRIDELNPACPVRGHSHYVASVAWNHDGSL